MSGSAKEALALVLNSGPSSIKFGLFEMGCDTTTLRLTARSVCRGGVGSIGSTTAQVWCSPQSYSSKEMIKDHVGAMERIVSLLEDRGYDRHVFGVVSHRVVHGGAEFTRTCLLEDSVEAVIEKHSKLAPLHNPGCLLGIRAAKDLLPAAPHAAVFDTAFHARSLQPEVYRYAVPREWFSTLGVRRYGFHGVSYQNVISKLDSRLTRSSIILHLGSRGSSACCIHDGASVDTSMGMTPLEGLVMGTRCGDLDAGVVKYVAETMATSIEEVESALQLRSGLLALSGVSSEMADIAAAAEAGDERCVLARSIFAERVRKYIGAYLVKLEGHLDSLIFTGSVGEVDAKLRELTCRDMHALGVAIDGVKNQAIDAAEGPVEISSTFSRTKVLVVPSDEEQEMALEATRCVGLLDAELEALRAAKTAEDSAKLAASLGASSARHETSSVPPLGRAIFVDGASPTAIVEVGLLYQVLGACGGNVGFFRPVCDDDDRNLLTIRELFQLSDPIDTMRGCTVKAARAKLGAGREEELLDEMVAKFVAYASTKDFVVVSRCHLEATSDPHWTAKVASALGVPVLYAASASTQDELTESVARVKTALESKSARLAGVAASLSGEALDNAAGLATCLRDTLKVHPALLAPAEPIFSQTTMAEIAATIEGATVLFGQADLAQSIARGVVVATRHTADVLETLDRLPAGQLVVTHASRADLVLALVLAHQSLDFPPIAGMLLSGTDGGDASVDASHFAKTLDLLTSVSSSVRLPPIACVAGSTYEAANAVHEMKPILLPSSTAKIEAAQVLFEKHLDDDFRAALLPCANMDAATAPADPTPKIFQHQLFAQARAKPQRIVLPEGNDRRVVTAAAELLRRGLCHVIVLGDPDAVRGLAAEARADLSRATILDTKEPPPDMIDALVAARKHKGMTPENAGTLLRDDPNYYGTMMLHLGLADGMVSGACHSTAATMRPALQIVKMMPGVTIASSVFFMLLQSGVKVFGDCAINVSPDAHDLSQIAVASARTARAFGIEPRVALLSYATGDSNKGELIDKVRDATAKARRLAPDEQFEGPIQFDAAVDPAVANVKYKGQGNAVAGKANVLIFPTLDAGNSAYKAVQQASKTIAVGPVMQGLRMPVNDLSRGCTVDDIVNTVVVTCLQAQDASQQSACA